MANRLLCSVLEEMRKACETSNYGYMPGLIEEVQTLANRMESALGEKHDMEYYREQRKELKAEVRELRKKKKKLQKDLGIKEQE